jgi:hypothetical protein
MTKLALSLPLTAAAILARLLTVDGASSGLDADLLDGQHGSYYRDAGNLNAGTLAVARGGTGLASYTAGDLLYASGTTALSKLAIGASGTFLKSTGSAPSWSALAASDIVSGILSPTYGGTGVNNGGNALTIPATGTAGLLGLAQTWTAVNTFTARPIVSLASDSAQLRLSRTGTATGTIYWGTNGDRDSTNTYDIATVYNSTLGNRIEIKLIDGSIPEISAAGSGSTGIKFTNTAASTSTSSGAVILTAGGLGASGAGYFGGNLTAGGNPDPFSRTPGRAIGVTAASGNAGLYVNAASAAVAEFWAGVNGTRYGGFTCTASAINFQALNSAEVSFGVGGTSYWKINTSGNLVQDTDGTSFVFQTGTGVKFGTATNQKMGWWNATPVVKGTVTGSRGGNAALDSLLSVLATYGLIVNSSSA